MTITHSTEIGQKRAFIQIDSWLLAVLGWGGLAVALAGLGLFLAMNLTYVQARFPGSQPVGEAQFSLGSVFSGRLSQTGTYRTPANLEAVTHWYQGRFGAEAPADDTVNVRAGCSTAMKTEQWAFIQRTFVATLCAQSQGTSVYLYQTISLWR